MARCDKPSSHSSLGSVSARNTTRDDGSQRLATVTPDDSDSGVNLKLLRSKGARPQFFFQETKQSMQYCSRAYTCACGPCALPQAISFPSIFLSRNKAIDATHNRRQASLKPLALRILGGAVGPQIIITLLVYQHPYHIATCEGVRGCICATAAAAIYRGCTHPLVDNKSS
jgi:hypothetical protein